MFADSSVDQTCLVEISSDWWSNFATLLAFKCYIENIYTVILGRIVHPYWLYLKIRHSLSSNDIAAGMHGKALMSSNMAAKRRTTFILRNYRHSCQNRGYGQSLNAFLRVGCNECKNLHLQIICTSFRFLYFSFFSPTVPLYTNHYIYFIFCLIFIHLCI